MDSSSSSSSSSIEVPQFFLCPISLQIMKDPVTAATGITYDRTSIERWLFSDRNATCPVTNQPLPDDQLLPNHTLRRLIQAWCIANSIDRIPTPRAPLDSIRAESLLSSLPSSLPLLLSLINDNETNRRRLVQSGAASCLIQLIVNKPTADVIEPACALLIALRLHSDELQPLLTYELLDSLSKSFHHESVILFAKSVASSIRTDLLERLSLQFFRAVVDLLIQNHTSTCKSTKAALQVLLLASPFGRNRTKMVEAGAVNALIELELTGPEKRRTELVLAVLDHLCGCADGRAEVVGHAAGIAVVSKRILRVSAAADEKAVGVILSVCKYSATKEVLNEMLRVGAVSKLCLVIQADCEGKVRAKARWVLRLHAGAWRNSPCVSLHLLTN